MSDNATQQGSQSPQEAPTVLVVGSSEEKTELLQQLQACGLDVEQASPAEAAQTVVVAAPDLVLITGDAAKDGGAAVLRGLSAFASSGLTVVVVQEPGAPEESTGTLHPARRLPADLGAAGVARRVAALTQDATPFTMGAAGRASSRPKPATMEFGARKRVPEPTQKLSAAAMGRPPAAQAGAPQKPQAPRKPATKHAKPRTSKPASLPAGALSGTPRPAAIPASKPRAASRKTQLGMPGEQAAAAPPATPAAPPAEPSSKRSAGSSPVPEPAWWLDDAVPEPQPSPAARPYAAAEASEAPTTETAFPAEEETTSVQQAPEAIETPSGAPDIPEAAPVLEARAPVEETSPPAEPGAISLDASELEPAGTHVASTRPAAMPAPPPAGQEWNDDSVSARTPWSWSTSSPETETLDAAPTATADKGNRPAWWAALQARSRALPPAARWSGLAAAVVLLGATVTLASLGGGPTRRTASSAPPAASAADPSDTAEPAEIRSAARTPAGATPTPAGAAGTPAGATAAKDPARALEEDMAALEAEVGEEDEIDSEEEPRREATEQPSAETAEAEAEDEPIPRDRARRIAIARSLVERGQRMRRHRRLGMAESYYLRALRHFDHYPRAASGLVKVHLARGDAREALRWAKRLVSMKPNRRSYRYLLGEAYAMNGNMRRARRHWLRAARWGLKVAAKRLEETSR